MQGLITLDFGNSSPHAGFFQKTGKDWNLLKIAPLSELSLFASQLEMTAHNTSIVLSEVKSREDDLAPLIEKGFLLTRLKDYWRGEKFSGMRVNYAKTLGEDRLIEAFYAFKKIKVPTLIIDAGTFVTMDVITTDGFQGGYIIPGLEGYYSNYARGEKLKDVSLESNISSSLPKNTAEAMTGSYAAFASLARELVKEHHLQKVLLTGGTAETWKNFISFNHSSVDVEVNPHLIHWALQHWFTTQIETL